MSAGALTIGSLFSGYLGLDLGVRSVFPDAREAWVSDVDKGANKILAHRAPGVPNLGDITAIDWAAVEPVDIITGGSPCQDLSQAGRRAGMAAGTRSGLWESMREAVAVLKPRLVVWENVRGALSASATSELEHCPGCMGGAGHARPPLRALGRVLGDLADLGYDAQWYGLRAADLGACHARWRVFVMAWPADSDLAGLQERWDAGGVPATTPGAPAVVDGDHRLRAGLGGLTLLPTPTASDANGAGAHGTGGADLKTTVQLLPTPAATNPNDGEGAASWLARRERVKLTANNGNGMGMPLPIQLLPTPRVKNNENRQSEGYGGLRGNFHGLLSGAVSWGEYAAAIARHEQAWGVPAPAPTEAGPGGARLSARFVEWMMCLPEGWVTDVPGITRSEALRALGNGVVPAQAAHALTLCLSRAEAIRGAHHHPSRGGTQQ